MLSTQRIFLAPFVAVAVLGLTPACAGNSGPATEAPQETLQVEAPVVVSLLEAPSLELAPGQTETLNLQFEVAPGFHINSSEPGDEFVVPTALQLEAPGLIVSTPVYPEGQGFDIPGLGTIAVYSGQFAVTVEVRATPEASGELALTGCLRFQACDERGCLSPRSIPLSLPIEISTTVGGAVASDKAAP